MGYLTKNSDDDINEPSLATVKKDDGATGYWIEKADYSYADSAQTRWVPFYPSQRGIDNLRAAAEWLKHRGTQERGFFRLTPGRATHWVEQKVRVRKKDVTGRVTGELEEAWFPYGDQRSFTSLRSAQEWIRKVETGSITDFSYRINPLRLAAPADHDVDPQEQQSPERARTAMNYSTAILLIRKDVRVVTVSYEADPVTGKAIGNLYSFKTLDPDLKVGDFVVVPTETRHHATVCRVELVDVEVDFDSGVKLKWIISKLDKTHYDEIVAKEEEIIVSVKKAEKRRRQEELAGKLIADNPELAEFGKATLVIETTVVEEPAKQ